MLFEKPTLTKIIGTPTYLTLIKLKNELKANVLSVPSHLGGSNHGHLGQVLTAAEYERIAPGTPYIKPAHPGDVVIPPFALDAVQILERHKEATRRYYEAVNIKKY